MKSILFVLSLLISANCLSQNFDPQKQGIYFKTDSMDTEEHYRKYAKYKDSSISAIYNIPYMPFLQWSVTSKSVYLRKEGKEGKKIGTVKSVVVTNLSPSLKVIEYRYIMDECSFCIYYDLDEKKFLYLWVSGQMFVIRDGLKIL